MPYCEEQIYSNDYLDFIISKDVLDVIDISSECIQKIEEENDEYVDYYDPNNNDVIEFMMRVDSFSGETKKEAIDLYIEDLKKDYNVFSSDEILYDSLSGVRLGTSSLMYSDEYFYEYLLFDDEKVYTVMFFNRINKENENEFKEKFKNITDNYMKSIKIKKYDIY